MPNNPVGWFEIYVQDMPRARRFYETVLGVQLTPLAMPEGGPEIEMLAFPLHESGSGATGALAKLKGADSGGNSVVVYFSCEDCGVEAGRVAAEEVAAE